MRRTLFTLMALSAFAVALAIPVSAQTTKPTSAVKTTPPPSVKTKNLGKVKSSAPAKATPANPVNLNSASVAQLQTLPGVGPSAAQRILEYRQKNGSFKKIEELMNVKGIGEKSFLKLKPLVTVSGDKGDHAGAEK